MSLYCIRGSLGYATTRNPGSPSQGASSTPGLTQHPLEISAQDGVQTIPEPGGPAERRAVAPTLAK
jgi:hypothetical protein